MKLSIHLLRLECCRITISPANPGARTTDPALRTFPRFGVFRRDGQLFGLPIEFVIEVIAGQKLTRVPRTAVEVAGLLNLRGEILTVLMADNWLGLEPRDYDASKPILVLRHGRVLFGIQVDAVQSVVTIPPEEIQARPERTDGAGGAIRSGVWQRLNRPLLTLIDGRLLVRFIQQALAPKISSEDSNG